MILDVLNNGRLAIIERPRFERLFLVLWLLGPFILLIERTPADIWLTILSLSFIVRMTMLREGLWLNLFWVRAAFMFWGICFVSAALSSSQSYSIGEALIWFRFPMFAMATAFWLANDRRLLELMLLSTACAIATMCCILLAELILEGYKERLSWPYDDLVPGNFLAKVGLPVVVVGAALSVSLRGYRAALIALFCIAIVTMTLMTGERINLLLVVCAGVLSTVVWRPNLRYFIPVILVVAVTILSVFQIFPSTGQRFFGTFLEHLPIYVGSDYYNAMVPAIHVFKAHPFFGIGPGNFRYLCGDFVTPEFNLLCHNHPHNFYLQILAEVGLVGLSFGVLFIASLVLFCYNSGRKFRMDVIVVTAWIIPFALFWPIRSSADFFGQWNNIFLWSSIALAMAAVTSSAKTKGTN
jgi:O-antigen ligase